MSALKNFFNDNINRDLDSLRKRWTQSIIRTATLVFGVITITEVVIFFLFSYSYTLGNFNREGYLTHFLLFPFILNLITVCLMHIVGKSKLKDGSKSYLCSLLFVVLIFIMNIVHSFFQGILLTFVVPVILTVVYGNKKLTNTIAAFSLILEIICEFFITWDTSKPDPLASAFNFAPILVSFIIQFSIYGICTQILKFEIIKLKLTKDFEKERLHLMEEAMRDSLTGIFNRKAFAQHLDDISKNRMPEDNFVMAMIDLDNFKKINDNLGHKEGDKALIIAAENILMETTKLHGNAFRYGGDEFVLIFRNESYNDVFKICLQIKKDYEKSLTRPMKDVDASMSFGVAEGNKNTNLSDILILADKNMYAYKKDRKVMRQG